MSEQQSDAPKNVDSEPKAADVETPTVTQKEDAKEEQDWLSIGASWGSAWLQTAKNKTVSTYELVKRDLSEFTDAVQLEATALASATANTVKQQAAQLGSLVAPDESEGTKPAEKEGEEGKEKQKEEDEKEEDGGFGMGWMKSLVSTVKSLGIEDTTAGEKDIEVPVTADLHAFDSAASSRLYAIQTDQGTYTCEPEGAPELFDDWLEHFYQEDRKQEVSQLLAANPAVRALYSQLVPAEMTNALFWQRYFYKVHQFQLDEARRRALINRATDLTVKTSWGDSDADFESGPESPQPITAEPTSKAIPSTDKTPSPSPPGGQQHSPVSMMSPDRRSSASGAVDETWSVCSNREIEIREMPDDETTDPGPLTPRPTDDTSAPTPAQPKDQETRQEPVTPSAEKKGDDWVDWDDE
uniref:BSD domain-containing protein n=1 Tax=Plectus sambesii TaxID=2011161 RepID=A0A914W3H3_9BILA